MLTKHAYLIESAVSGRPIMNHNYVYIYNFKYYFNYISHRQNVFGFLVVIISSINSDVNILHNVLFKKFPLPFNDLFYYRNLLINGIRLSRHALRNMRSVSLICLRHIHLEADSTIFNCICNCSWYAVTNILLLVLTWHF